MRDEDRYLTRRTFMRSAGVLGAGLLIGCGENPTMVPGSALLAKGGVKGKPGNGGGGGSNGRFPLRIPATQSPTGTLTVAPADVDLGGGTWSNVWAYNGQFPGPTLVVDRGGPAGLTLSNGLAQDTITHWHGMLVDDVNDGHPRHAVAPGGSFGYTFTVDQRATMNWYHPHPHGLTGEQVAMGLAGAFIIRDDEERALQLPTGDREVPLIIRDASFNRQGDMQYKPRSGGFEGDTPLVNGTLNPTLAADAAVYRFRVLNGSNARIYRLALSTGDPFWLIGNDGGLLATTVGVLEIMLSPAERIDVLVDLRGRAGQSVLLRDLDAGWDLLELDVGDTVVDDVTIPTTPSSITPLSGPAVPDKEFSFDGMSKINGQVYELTRVDFTIRRGVTERWRFTTKGNAPHPVHVHGAYFQVQSRSGGRGRLYPWEAGWKDTVLLEDGETVDVLIRFDHAAVQGLYLMHCHKLEHEDMGMMANFEVL